MIYRSILSLIIIHIDYYVKHIIVWIYCTTISTLMVNTFFGLFLMRKYG